MKRRNLITILAVILALCGCGFAAEIRTWTSTDGKTIEARLIESSDNEVKIRRVSDGRQFSIPLTRLSEVDRRWVEALGDDSPSPAATSADLTELTQIPEDPDGTILLPLRVYLISDLELEQKGVKMSTWVTREDFVETVLPEINRIWKAARIEWALESIVIQPAAEVPDREAAIEYIQNAKRNAAGKSDPARMPKIHAFCDKANGHPVVNSLYFFPYLGQTSQGNAAMRGNFAVVGVWTDKPSRAVRPPQKSLLVEELPFKIGSIGRTCAHELGHNLGLGHPDSATQTQFGLLMGGKKSGYELTSEEIALARKTATDRATKILQWVESAGAD
ncbi:MAG: hypothetical protein P1U87_18740 [Verrucomicrobiales bacterium]|nr:hypothetical protein [Verrucomicrobiales bacterium]